MGRSVEASFLSVHAKETHDLREGDLPAGTPVDLWVWGVLALKRLQPLTQKVILKTVEEREHTY